MRRGRTSLWLSAALCVNLLAGCQSSMGRHSWSEDPLVLSKKPVNIPAESTPPTPLARVEPAQPPSSPIAALDTDRTSSPAGSPDGRLANSSLNHSPVQLIAAARGPVPVVPATRIKPDGTSSTLPELQRQVPGTFGHHPAYAWLQGVLDRHYHGHMELRYCDASVEDRWGGKVCLQDDPRLSSLHDGDLIVVRGTMETTSPPLSEGWHYPHYHIDAILLLHRGN